MKISLGADHRGLKFKEKIKSLLVAKGIETADFGTSTESSTDYPDYAIKAAQAVARKDADYGILICGSGNGMAITANKVKGIRAGLANNIEMARLARAHNNANVLVLSEMFTPEDQIEAIINTFINTAFEGGRHARRIGKITDYEKG